MALIVMDVLRFEYGLKIPDDIGIVGYDNVPPSRLASYDLTTVSQPIEQMVQQTVFLLMCYMENKPLKRGDIKLAGELIIRSSSKKNWG